MSHADDKIRIWLAAIDRTNPNTQKLLKMELKFYLGSNFLRQQSPWLALILI